MSNFPLLHKQSFQKLSWNEFQESHFFTIAKTYFSKDSSLFSKLETQKPFFRLHSQNLLAKPLTSKQLYLCSKPHNVFRTCTYARTHTHTARINNDTTEQSLCTTSKNRGYAAHKKKINVTFLQFSQKFSDYGDYLLRLGYILYLLLSCFPYSHVYYSSVLWFTHKSGHFLIYQWQVNQRMWQSLYTLIRYIQRKHFLIYIVQYIKCILKCVYSFAE